MTVQWGEQGGRGGVTRRRLLVGSIAAGAAVWLTGTRSTARADAALEYAGREAFDVAEQAYFEQGFSNNETGGYAWGASYYLLGLLRMYEAYQDPDYLDRFVDYADVVLNNTDGERGVTDYAGRSGTVWRTAGNYTAAHGTVVDHDGRPAVQLRWAGTRGAETTGEVSAVAGDRFDLTVTNPATIALTLTDLSLDPDDDRYLVTMINSSYQPSARWTAVDLRQDPVATTVRPTKIEFAPQFYVFAVHTGMISYPLAKFARMVLEAGRAGRHQGQAKRMLAAARRAVAFHDHEFVFGPDGGGDYVFESGAPIPFDGTIEPYNQSHAIGQTMAELYRLTGEDQYRRKLGALVKSYRTGLTTSETGAQQWTYWPVNSQVYRGYTAADDVSAYTPAQPAARQIEDISHAAISVEFVAAAAEAGVREAVDLVPGFAKTYTDHVIRSAGDVWWRVDGTGTTTPGNAVQCARWGAYARIDSGIYRHALGLYEAVQLVPDQGSHALGIAYLNWGRREGWR